MDGPPRKRRQLPRGCGLWIWMMVFFGLWGAFSFLYLGHESKKLKQRVSQIMARAIADAVEEFQSDYQRLPLPSGPRLSGGDCDTDTSPTHGFTAILAGKEGEAADRQNERTVDYFEGIKPAKKRQGTAWNQSDGLITPAAGGTYGVVDYFGNPYRIRLDTNGDQQLANPNPDQAAQGTADLAKRVIVWSAGKDGKLDTWDDNLMSWD